MSVSAELIAELKARPIGPAVAQAKAISDVDKEVSISNSNVDITAKIDPANVSEGTALRFLEDEGLTPEDWEVTHFRRIEYGQGMQSVKFSYRKIAQEAVGGDLSASVYEECRSLIRDVKASQIATCERDGTYLILIADSQFGKKGTKEAVFNLQSGVRRHAEEARHLIEMGLVRKIHVAWMGDETENVANHYANQPATIELNRTEQLELDFEMRVWTLKQVLDLGVPVSASSVISNHGEWTRNGSKDSVTSKGDNASTYIARQVERLFKEMEPFTGVSIDWTIGDGSTPGVIVNLSGIKCRFTHGHIEKGRGANVEKRTVDAMERQILGDPKGLGDVELWFTAHYHHSWENEAGERTYFGCPALEAEKSSEYMLEQYGVWSIPGMLGLVVSDVTARGWQHKNIF